VKAAPSENTFTASPGKIIVDEGEQIPYLGEVTAGTCTALLFEVKRAYQDDDSLGLHDQADSLSGEAQEYLLAALDHEYKPNSQVAKAAGLNDWQVPNRILVIDVVQIHPDFRGRAIGLGAVAEIEKIYGTRGDFIFLKAEPMQKSRPEGEKHRMWNDKMRLPPYSPTFDRKLMSHWRKIGFSRVGRTPYMVKAGEGE
jgi:hypothetical protein